MPLPPMYFPVYNLHFRLLDPGLHGQPFVGTPPVPHVEGLHTVQWAMSDQSRLTSTVQGDGMRFALKDYDTGRFIPHLPIPLSAGPFLLDTINNSQYLVLFNQPDVKLDGKEVGIFFWGIAPTWRCHEIKLPFPPIIGKKMKELGKLGAARKAASEAQKRGKKINDALDKIDELANAAEYALETGALTPEGAAKNEAKQAKAQAEIDKNEKAQLKAADKQYAADKWAADVDAEGAAAGSAPAEDPAEQQARAEKSDADSKAAREEEKAALKEKKEADKLARKAQREADKQDAAVKAKLSRDTTDTAVAAASVDEHAQKADAKREQVAAAKATAKEAEDRAKKAQKAGSDARKAKSTEDRRRELAKEHHAKHGKGNPYKDATGIGNVNMAFPSITAHVPFPCTVQIYMSWSALLKNWLNAALGMVAGLLNAYVGFFFDSIGAGRGVMGTWAANLAKAMTTAAVTSTKNFITDGKVAFKVSTKAGVVTTSGEISQDSKTGEWTWKTSADAGKSGSLGEIKGGASAEGKLEQKEGDVLPDANMEGWSASGSAKATDKKYAPTAGYSHSEKSVPGKDGAPSKQVTTDSYSASVGKGKGSYTKETSESSDGTRKVTETESIERDGAKGSHSTATTTDGKGGEKVTTTDTAGTPGISYKSESTVTSTNAAAPVNYSGGAPGVGTT